MTDEEFKNQYQKSGEKKQIVTKGTNKNTAKTNKNEIKELKKKQKEKKLLQKAKKKYGITDNKSQNEIIEKDSKDSDKGNELSEKLSKLSKEQQDALLKLLER